MSLIPILALILGVVLGFALGGPVEGPIGLYLAIAAVAGLDTIFGGIRSAMEGKFSNEIFVTGFVTNVALSCGAAWLGERMGIDLYLAAVIILGTRIFSNISLMRRLGFNRLQEMRRKRRMEAEQGRIGAS